MLLHAAKALAPLIVAMLIAERQNLSSHTTHPRRSSGLPLRTVMLRSSIQARHTSLPLAPAVHSNGYSDRLPFLFGLSQHFLPDCVVACVGEELMAFHR